MITYLEGDATAPATAGPKIIAHVCNDIGQWGRGFVLAVEDRWPHVKEAYLSLPAYKLGYTQFVKAEEEIWIANMIAMRDRVPHGGVPPIRYEALWDCLSDVRWIARASNASIHMPRIGSKLAGGKWSRIEKMIRVAAPDISVFVYDYTDTESRSYVSPDMLKNY